MKRVVVISMVILLACLVYQVQAETLFTGQKGVINGDGTTGFINKEQALRVRTYAKQDDSQAFKKAMMEARIQGTLASFTKGEIVYCVDTDIWSGLVKVRRQGDTTEYWTAKDFVSKVNPD